MVTRAEGPAASPPNDRGHKRRVTEENRIESLLAAAAADLLAHQDSGIG